MKTLQLKDFLEYKFLNNVKISPDGQSCVFGVSVCDEKINEYQNNLYLWYDGTCSVLTSSGKDSGAIWLDNDTVMFRSGRSAEMQERVKREKKLQSFTEFPYMAEKHRNILKYRFRYQKWSS